MKWKLCAAHALAIMEYLVVSRRQRQTLEYPDVNRLMGEAAGEVEGPNSMKQLRRLISKMPKSGNTRQLEKEMELRHIARISNLMISWRDSRDWANG